MVLMLVSLTDAGVAGIGIIILGKEPEPPLRTFFSSLACACLSPAYFAATSFNAGPTTFMSTLWHELQPLLLKRASPSSAANAVAEIQSEAVIAMM
jgi:hypothetical protein